MCSEVRFRRAIGGWLVGCATVTTVIYVLLLGIIANGPGGLSIKSIGAGIYIALVPPAIILVIQGGGSFWDRCAWMTPNNFFRSMGLVA